MPRFSLLILFKFFLLAISACSVQTKLVSVERSNIEINDAAIQDDSLITAFIAPFKDAVDREMNHVLIVSEMPMIKAQPEGLLGNAVADLILKKAREYAPELNPDLCLLNNGGLRTSLPEGEITKGKVFELMPFENELVVLTLSAENTRKLFNYIARAEGMPVSGVKMGIKGKEAVNIFINNIPFDSTATYKVVTSDYLAAGGDKMSFFNDPMEEVILKRKLRDAIIEYMIEEHSKGNKFSAELDGRVYYE
jgi:2',3'-cyclic-nucleotide 2'-phosphodiesterase (5'-nucleotidase family)